MALALIGARVLEFKRGDFIVVYTQPDTTPGHARLVWEWLAPQLLSGYPDHALNLLVLPYGFTLEQLRPSDIAGQLEHVEIERLRVRSPLAGAKAT